jgi:hypothetical protein
MDILPDDDMVFVSGGGGADGAPRPDAVRADGVDAGASYGPPPGLAWEYKMLNSEAGLADASGSHFVDDITPDYKTDAGYCYWCESVGTDNEVITHMQAIVSSTRDMDRRLCYVRMQQVYNTMAREYTQRNWPLASIMKHVTDHMYVRDVQILASLRECNEIISLTVSSMAATRPDGQSVPGCHGKVREFTDLTKTKIMLLNLLDGQQRSAAAVSEGSGGPPPSAGQAGVGSASIVRR